MCCRIMVFVFCCKQKTAYEMRSSDWSSDLCSSDLTDPEFLAWLRRDSSAAIKSFGFEGRQGEHMVVVENTDRVHNVVVCTLCSCYPWPVLGLPPVWYKSAPYRSRAVIAPRGVLAA